MAQRRPAVESFTRRFYLMWVKWATIRGYDLGGLQPRGETRLNPGSEWDRQKLLERAEEAAQAGSWEWDVEPDRILWSDNLSPRGWTTTWGSLSRPMPSSTSSPDRSQSPPEATDGSRGPRRLTLARRLPYAAPGAGFSE